MRLRVILLGLLTASLPLVAAPAAEAIVGGDPDGDRHPAVGGLVSPTPFSDGTYVYCSGSLISPTVFLTAAHCGTTGEDVAVTLASTYTPASTTYAGTFVADPAYPAKGSSDPHDIAVVLLDAPVTGVTPVRLPAADSLTRLPSGSSVVGVGYGAVEVVKQKGGKDRVYADERRQALGRSTAVTPTWLKVSINQAQGWGGGCNADSGGPNFLGSSDIVGGLTITGDANCRATNVTYRLDTPSAREFLGAHVELP